ncbi:MAG TPA: DMT family transporter [Casimicrobiaceae bacterium]|nr:DMT family transporter [Casimicrobiaceae bacterium]
MAGSLFAIVGTFGFSFKGILIKLAYAAHPVDPTTLLTLRMLYSAPFFAVMAWWSGRNAPAISRGDGLRLLWLGFIGYYLSSLLDFIGLQYISASLERLVLYLYPTLVLVLSAMFLKKAIGRREVVALGISYIGIVLVVWHDLRVAGDLAPLALGSGLVFAASLCYAIYLVGAGGVIGRIGSTRFISWAMLASTVFVAAQFFATRSIDALDVPARVHWLSLAMAVFSTVLPTWLIAEALRRIGAKQSSLVGSLGPVFTIGLGAWLLNEPMTAIQLAGAALVLAGVLLVTLKSQRRPQQGGS